MIRTLIRTIGLARLAGLGMLSALYAPVTTPVQAADYTLTPSVTVSEEFTDNVFQNSGSKRSDFITRFMPGAVFVYHAPRWDWDLSYFFDYRHYARDSRSDDFTHMANAHTNIRVLNELLFLDVQDSYSRVSLDVSRDISNESLFANQSDQNTLNVSPYLVLRPLPLTTINLGYRYVNTWYREPSGIDKERHIGYLSANYELTPRFSINGGYQYAQEFTSQRDFSSQNVYAGVRYEYADRSFVYGQGGGSWTDFRDSGSFSSPTWSVGLTHAFATAVLNLSTGVEYTEDPQRISTEQTYYRGAYDLQLPNGSIGLFASYAEFLTTETDQEDRTTLRGGIVLQHELVARLTGRLGFTAERYRQELLDAHTNKYYVDAGLSYLLNHDITIGVTYRYINYSSPTIAADNYTVNRGIIELRKVF